MTIGLHGESQSLLDAADNDFYVAHDEGDAHAASAVDTGSDDSDEAWSDESGEGEPSAKRVDLGSSVEDLGATLKEITVTRRTLIRVLRHRQTKEAMTSLKISYQR